MPADADFDPVAIIAALNRHGVEYVVVGGFAVATHGVIRATDDLDLVVNREWDNAGRLAAALGDLEARSVTEPGAELTQELLVRRADRRLTTSSGDVHLLHEVAGLPDYTSLLPGDEVVVDGEPVRVMGLSALRAAKQASGRPKDLIDLTELDQLYGPED